MTKKSNELLISPGDRLRAARRAAGYRTAKKFAIINKIKVSTYIAHESGRNPINPFKAEYYGSLLNVSSLWLLEGRKEEGYEFDKVVMYDSSSPTSTEKSLLGLFVLVYNQIAFALLEEKLIPYVSKFAQTITLEGITNPKLFDNKGEKISMTENFKLYIQKRMGDLNLKKE